MSKENPSETSSITIRYARTEDIPAIVEFNQTMAWETEQKNLHTQTIRAGVQSLLAHPDRGFYIVAAMADQVVACLMITFEWSDWRNGLFWWVQSVYVRPNWRRRGIYSRMYSFVKELAANDESNVCGFRLYVEQDNAQAQQTYQSLGMTHSPYHMFEQLASDKH